MKSRLETIDSGLAQEISLVSFSEAQAKVREILIQTMASMPGEAVGLLPKGFEIQSYAVSQVQIDELDESYFGFEESSEVERSTVAFMAARFLSAVMSWQAAKSHFELCEAAYEARFAVEIIM